MLERIIRMTVAAEWVPIVKDGRIQCFHVVKPEDGSRANCTENKMINIRPSQKVGTDTPNMATSLVTWSRMEYWRTAEIMPIVIPITMDHNVLNNASLKVVGKRSKISSATGCFVV